MFFAAVNGVQSYEILFLSLHSLSSPFSMVHIVLLVCPLRFPLSHTLKDCEESEPTEEQRKSKDSSACGCVCVFLCMVGCTVGVHVWGHANCLFCRSSQHTSSLFN